MDHSEMYARLGQVVSKALYQHLSQVTELSAPGGRAFKVRMVQEPRIYNGSWAFMLDVALPKDEGTFTFSVAQFGSSFDPAKVTLPLPPKDFEDDSLKEFPAEHQEAFYALLDIVESELERRGFKHGLKGDFLINQDYYPSRGARVSVTNPRLLDMEIARSLQKELRRGDYSFYISLDLVMSDPVYQGKDEGIVIREDRIVEDWNIDRLRREFGERFGWDK